MIIADTSPLQYLTLTENIDVLPRLYGQGIIPEAVLLELQVAATPRRVYAWAAHLPDWVLVREAPNIVSGLDLDHGETEVISLALWMREHDDAAEALLMDDGKARRSAETFGLPTIGTLGVLVRAAVRGWVDLPDALRRLRDEISVRGTPALYDTALARFHEQTR
jgi:predicted nucleic acid-binding protein